jgi:hypothetical protein
VDSRPESLTGEVATQRARARELASGLRRQRSLLHSSLKELERMACRDLPALLGPTRVLSAHLGPHLGLIDALIELAEEDDPGRDARG